MRTQRAGSLTQGLVGAWCPSLGATGFRLQDRSGRNNHGTLTNMASTAWVTSGGKGALECVPNGFVVSSNIPARNNADPISLGGWFFAPAASYTGANYFLSIPNASSGSNGLDFSNPQAATLRFFGASAGITLSSSIDLRNKWTHLYGVFDGSRAILYANGELVTSTSHTAGTATASREFNLGRFGSFGGFTSIISDDVRLYYRALTAPEVRQLYIGGRGFGLIPERQRRRGTAAAAGTNRRRRILCGDYS